MEVRHILENIAVVNDNDEIIGYKEKMSVHKEGILHRAFSVVLFNSKNEMLLQRRSFSKYHSPGEWTNACCSHQRENETIKEAAIRRLYEELGINDAILEEEFIFHYKCQFENELWENEIDHVFIGRYDKDVESFNIDEVHEVRWISVSELLNWIDEKPEEFTFWFKILIKKAEELKKLYTKY
ncbi:isopentenyl-diphosphate Delta-isomerase [Clostridium fungisolvens]|uniref:Isopentenyl-diphosphate delta-isomerase n=1 Tax=Clostridium fungisolvens TaxID=1604897 RepID=A0A6V8SEL8_9CLOT|nr:isopentenyl-diphosphate Delta-isomerase [Clostridium fungisolvens]GFP75679.1 Isopentenyl-diphosphate Delta-isomerase [Clostridium fungisolvens]